MIEREGVKEGGEGTDTVRHADRQRDGGRREEQRARQRDREIQR